MRWRGDALHLAGFPFVTTGTKPTFSAYLAATGFAIGSAPILRYNGGPIVNGTNPIAVVPNVNRIERGQAYWIRVNNFSRYYGPLKVEIDAGSGDSGLSSLLAKLQGDWTVAKGRLGINNPDTYGTLFSLRRELFNLPYKEDGSAEDHVAWQDKLRSCLVPDLRADPTIAAHALPTSNPSRLAQPGFIISFPSTIETGQNFFARALNAGDSAFSSASFSTKINSVGVVFQGYQGMNPYASGSSGVPGTPTHTGADALAATPYVYLIPGGTDSMRTPPLNGAPVVVRNWQVLDFAMPLPFDLGSSGFGQNTVWTGNTSLSEPFFTPRKHQPFRAVSDPTLFYSRVPDEFTNRRLIGRSVWNTEWKLVIPAQTLLADPQDGIERFIRSVKDIKIYLRTYSAAGN